MADEHPDSVLQYEAPARRSPRRWFGWGDVFNFIVVFGLLLLLLWGLLFNGLTPHDSRRLRCAMNLRMIGQALIMYYNEHRGYPWSLADGRLMIDVDALRCPAGGHKPVTIYDLQVHPEWLTDPAYVAYTYVSPTSNDPAADEILAFETIDHTGHDGGNVLFGDMRVEWWTTVQLDRLRRAHAAGVRPLLGDLANGDADASRSTTRPILPARN